MDVKPVTALLLNWKRPDNLKKIIYSLQNQSLPINIFLWNNNIEDQTKYDVDLQINSTKNLMCSPRWLMANYSKSEYFFSLDDDLCPNDPLLIEDCYNFATADNCAVGYTGVILSSSKHYWSSHHITPNPSANQKVDVIKGRFLFCSKNDLSKVNFIHYDKASNFRIEDDIIVSSQIKNKVIPSILHKRFLELPQPHALFKESDHKQSRVNAILKYFS